MLLTIAEMWHAVDMLVTGIIPLLRDYDPEIPVDYFHPLLLPKFQEMQRLYNIEQYIADRRHRAVEGNPSTFANLNNKRHFSGRYFASSELHNALGNRIEKEATNKRDQKKQEWEDGSQEYMRQKARAEGLECKNRTDRFGWEEHDPSCEKCLLNKSAEAMRITRYEWPLPDSKIPRAAAVVELDCPASFVAWRNITWMLLHDLGSSRSSKNDPASDTLFTFAGLHSFTKERQSRLTLASKVKSFVKSHYKQKFPVAFQNCYSNNALQYQLFDTEQKCWVDEQMENPSLTKWCTLELPSGPYTNLQYAIDSTDHTQNRVIADQDSCSAALSLYELISFGSLRADGEQTQWLNIRRELAAKNLDLNTDAVNVLITQTAWQAGSRTDTVHRTSHNELCDAEFCSELLATAQMNLNSVEANWKSDHAVSILIVVVQRIASLALDHSAVNTALVLLEAIRIATFRWTEELSKLLHDSTEATKVQAIRYRLLKAALLCKAIYDVDSEHLRLVMNSNNDLYIWITCSILIRDNSPHNSKDLPTDLRRLKFGDLFLMRKLYKITIQLVIEHRNDGLDKAIAKVWSGHHSVPSSWSSLPVPNARWLQARTKQSQLVLYNTMDGELLVNGKPLGRLPKEFVASEMYQRLFGAQVLDVFAANTPGMDYMSARTIHGFYVYFAMRKGKVIIRSQRESQVLKLIPHDIFLGDLPSAFVNDYVHWLDISSHEIEFRPLNQRWTSSPDYWRLCYRPCLSSRLDQNGHALVDLRSKSFSAVMNVFRALETDKNTHVSVSNGEVLEVHFPRFDLRFFLDCEGNFQCRELRKMVDPDQSLGTLIGLSSRLVLCAPGKFARRHNRTLLIPHGYISIRKSRDHVKVSISTTGAKVRLFRYTVDPILRRLKGTNSIIRYVRLNLATSCIGIM